MQRMTEGGCRPCSFFFCQVVAIHSFAHHLAQTLYIEHCFSWLPSLLLLFYTQAGELIVIELEIWLEGKDIDWQRPTFLYFYFVCKVPWEIDTVMHVG